MPTNPLSMAGTTRRDLANGKDWVKFRDALDFGRDLRLTADTSVIETVTETDEEGAEVRRTRARVDWGIYQLHRLAAYIKEWSFLNADGSSPLPVSVASISRLDPEIGTELVSLLDAHLAEVALKNSPKSTRA